VAGDGVVAAPMVAGAAALTKRVTPVLGGYPKNSDDSPSTRENVFLTRSNTKLER
jgi:hypothetical protein